MMFPNAAAARLHLQAGSLRALAVTSASASEQFPELTTAQSAIAGYVSEAVFAVLAPPRTPSRTVRRLQVAIADLLHQADVRELILSAGLEIVASTAAYLASTIRLDMRNMAKVFSEMRS